MRRAELRSLILTVRKKDAALSTFHDPGLSSTHVANRYIFASYCSAINIKFLKEINEDGLKVMTHNVDELEQFT